MRSQIKILTLSYLTFLSFMIFTALFDGILSTIVYYLGFFAAISVGLGLYSGEEKIKIASVEYLRLDLRGAAATALVCAPTVAIVMGVSALTSLLISATVGEVQTVTLDGRIWVDILLHALLPALLEELLFRYLPLRVLSGGSRTCTVIISAVFFACVHTSLFSIPYALVAGVIFMMVDILADSVIPSLIIHLINNVCSILWLYFSENAAFADAYLITVLSLALVSLMVIILFGRGQIKRLFELMREGEKYVPSYEPLLFIIPTLVLAISELV